jgi:hypothetical protein
MKAFDPVKDVKNSQSILDHGQWPNFHDAEVHSLGIWRGDVRPEDNVWIGPVIEASFELSALENPYMAVLKFHDCDAIRMEDFNHQRERGNYRDGTALPPNIAVWFEQAFGLALSFTCFRIQALGRSEVGKG